MGLKGRVSHVIIFTCMGNVWCVYREVIESWYYKQVGLSPPDQSVVGPLPGLPSVDQRYNYNHADINKDIILLRSYI